MRICPTLNNIIITNIYTTELTMTEDAPNATDHDEDGKRKASSHSYDLPNQEDDDNDVMDGLTGSIKEWITELFKLQGEGE
jgi:hypothetical protein